MKFKEFREQQEFDHRLDPRLKGIVLELDRWLINYPAKPIELVVTCVNRTAAENAADGGKPTSAHLVGRAVDIRTHDWPAGLVDIVIQRLYKLWPGSFLYLLHHDVGSGMHLHMQIKMAHHLTDFAVDNDREIGLLSRESS